MESTPHDPEQIISPPYDFVLVTSIQESKPGENNYSASGIHLSQSSITGRVDKSPYLFGMGEIVPSTFRLPKGEVYDSLNGIKQCKKLFNDQEIRRAKREADNALHHPSA